jgi:hypothetical protein
MFTREDYEKYFFQIAHVERKMVYGVYDLASELDEPSLMGVLRKVGDDEVRHYGQVLKMLKLSLGFSQTENRREPREYYLGTVLLKSVQESAGGEIKAYCVNLSKTGICLESAQELPVDQVRDLEIRLFNQDPLSNRQGRIIWNKQVEPGLYIGGIQFLL